MRYLGIMFLSLAGCVSDGTNVPVARKRVPVAPRIVGRWDVATWNGARTAGVSLRFSPGGRVSGTVQCNTFAGTYVLNGASLDLRSIDVTALGCGGTKARKAAPVADELLAGDDFGVSVRSDNLALRSSRGAWLFRRVSGP